MNENATENSNLGQAYNDITQLFSTVTQKSTIEALEYITTLTGNFKGELSIEEYLLGYKDGNGRIVSHFVCSAGRNETLKALIKLAPGIVNSLDDALESPLFISVRAHNLESIKILLNNRADVTIKNIHGCNILHYACQTSDIELVKLFVSFVREKHFLEFDTFINTCSNELGTPLQWACMINNKEIVHYLLSCGADPNIAPLDKKIPSPLMLTLSIGDIELTKLILDSGALIKEARDFEGYTPIFAATEKNNFELLNLILEHMKKQSCDITNQAVKGETIYSYALKNQCSDQILKYLKDHSLNIISISQQQNSINYCNYDELTEQPVESGVVSEKELLLFDSKEQEKLILKLEEENIGTYNEEKAEEIKREANLFFKKGDYHKAISLYTNALEFLSVKKGDLSPQGITLKSSILSNRCLAYMKIKDTSNALKDSSLCTYIDPTWSKGYYRSSQVYQIIGDSTNQACYLWDAIVNENNNLELKQEYIELFSSLIKKCSLVNQ